MTQFFVFLIILVTAAACSLVGNFLVLKRLSLIGDAISHAVFPGIIIAFLIFGSFNYLLFFLAAVLFAILMAFLVQWLTENVRASRESLMGIVFTSLFALGVILLVQFANNVHLDQDAVLYGHVEFSAWERFIFWGRDFGPRNLWMMSVIFVINAIFIKVFYKELKLTTFDPGFAKTLAISPKLMDYLLIVLTSITIIAAFETVGAILVVALLIIPAATSYIFANRLFLMILGSLFVAVVSSGAGYFLAVSLDASIAGSVAMVAGAILFLAALLKVVFKRFVR